jgi:hypothetical protein
VLILRTNMLATGAVVERSRPRGDTARCAVARGDVPLLPLLLGAGDGARWCVRGDAALGEVPRRAAAGDAAGGCGERPRDDGDHARPAGDASRDAGDAARGERARGERPRVCTDVGDGDRARRCDSSSAVSVPARAAGDRRRAAATPAAVAAAGGGDRARGDNPRVGCPSDRGEMVRRALLTVTPRGDVSGECARGDPSSRDGSVSCERSSMASDDIGSAGSACGDRVGKAGDDDDVTRNESRDPADVGSGSASLSAQLLP